MGVDVFKTDFGEDIPEDARFHDGRTGAEVHNLYPLLYNAAVFEVTAEEKGRGLVWARSGTAGSQRFPVCWSGDPASDWDSLAATVRGGLSAGMSGLALWSHDIGGYRGRPDPELYVRWAQFGLFSSHSRMHGDSPREPWLFGDRGAGHRPEIRRAEIPALPLHPERGARGARHRDARPPRPAARLPGRSERRGLGPRIYVRPVFLVAPVIRRIEELGRGGGRRSGPPRLPVYLPAGEWIDYWTGRRYRGRRSVDAAAPLDIMPLFVRAGAIIPMMKRARRIPEGRIDPLELELYPSGTSGCVASSRKRAGRRSASRRQGAASISLGRDPFASRIVVRAGAKGAAPM